MRLALLAALVLGVSAVSISSNTAAGAAPAAPAATSVAPPSSTPSAAPVAVTGGAALSPARQPLEHLHHTAWTAKDGLAGNVLDIAQTKDGYLWLGTGSGLVRFDGVRFESFESLSGQQLPSRGVHALQAMPDNSLWVGFVEGGAAQIKDGRILRVDSDEPLSTASTRRFSLDGAGVLWAVDGSAVLRFSGQRWETWTVGLPEARGFHPMEMMADRAGNVWVSANTGLFVKALKSDRFIEVPLKGLSFPGMAADPQGRVWIVDMALDRGAMRLPRVPDAGADWDPMPEWQKVPAGINMPLVDDLGYLWFGSANGLARMRPPEKGPFLPGELERVTPASGGVSGNYMLRMSQDREGNVWVGTNAGLDRYRPTRLSQVPFPEPPAAVSMAIDASGAPWFSARDQALFRYGAGLERMDTGIDGAPTFIAMGAQGQRWLGYRSGLREWKDGKLTLLLPPGVENWNFSIINMHVDRDGVVWLVSNGLGFFRYDHGRWERFHQRAGVPKEPPVSLGGAADGTVWVGYLRGRLLRVRGEELKMLTAEEGLRVGTVKAISSRGAHVWAGGDTGVQRLDLPGMPALQGQDGMKLEGITGIVETPNGDLWLNGLTGICHVAAREIDRALSDPAYRVAVTRYDTLDGLPAFAEQAWPLKTAMRSQDGRLWFSTTNGVVTLDPATIRRNERAPDVFVQRVITPDSVFLHPQGGLRLPAGTRDLTLLYTATSLAIPERIRFRYRLVGLDKTWHEADARRSAFYTNLGPGKYRFEVVASNEDGVWGTTPAVADLEIQPLLTERASFRAGIALAVLLAVAWLVRWRTRAAARVEQQRLRVRLEERVRVARDLHDTLLQGFLGLVLRLEAVARAAPRQEPVRTGEELSRLMEVADGLLVEGRDRISDLHRPPAVGTLEEMLAPLGEDLSHHHGLSFELRVEGSSRALPPGLRDQLGLIAREAVFNAFQHSGGTRVTVTVDYAAKDLAVRVEDDGVGIPSEVLAEGGRRGHWGLAGMRARADQAGLEVRIESTPGTLTSVTVILPEAVERAA